MMLFSSSFRNQRAACCAKTTRRITRPRWSYRGLRCFRAGLGRLNVTTALGQPLVAEVDLSVAPGDDVDSIRVNIASPAVYRATNVEYQGVLQTVRAQVPNGQWRTMCRLASSQSINDPYLDIPLEVNSNTGRLVPRICVPAGPSRGSGANH